MDKGVRNILRNTVTHCRRLLEDAVGNVLEGRFGMHRDGTVEDAARMGHLSAEDQSFREQLIAHLRHIEVGGYKPQDAMSQLVREIAFTHLNRLCAYKMLEQRKLLRYDVVSRGLNSKGFIFYLADHPEDEALYNGGEQYTAYRHFLEWQGSQLSAQIGVLFSPHDPANRLFPTQLELNQVLDLLNSPELAGVWGEDETIGWVYQYFTPKELRDQVRKESAAPRNSYELAFRNQFFTPRYVVEFLVDNTLGRTWYEMRGGVTRLAERCRYMVRRYDEVILDSVEPDNLKEAIAWLQGKSDRVPSYAELGHTVNGYHRLGTHDDTDFREQWEEIARLREGDASGVKTQSLLDLLFLICRAERFGDASGYGHDAAIPVIMREVERRVAETRKEDRSQEEMLRQPSFVMGREMKDPRDIKILDPACGSGHFLLYCFDLLTTIYEEAYEEGQFAVEELRRAYPTREELRRDIPRLIVEHNLHGVDIDLRAVQIAQLALYLRAQRAFSEYGVEAARRPKISRSNIVCAEPMPGERDMLDEFTRQLDPPLLGQFVRVVFDKMRLAGEAGTLLKIEEELKEAIATAKKEWVRLQGPATDRRGNAMMFTNEELASISTQPRQPGLFDVSGISDAQFWDDAEERVLAALADYANTAGNGETYRRTLFAEDAAQGFAFVDLCQKRFDVALMNPPFGSASLRSKAYIEKCFPRTKNDVYAAFVERGLNMLHRRGMLGAITSRTGFFLSSFQKWREEIILKEARPTVVADLGMGVLDTAMVETAAYCLEVVR
ncbi:MAG: DNA methyltransferase [Chloroflexota bacterium]